jgi:5-methylcytosine-specific restriction endonuclease McrA
MSHVFANLPTLADRGRCATAKDQIVTRKQAKGKQERAESKQVKAIRAAVFERDRYLCRCCGHRPAESMHEIRPRSLGGKVSMTNSIALCGDGTRGCHGYITRHEVRVMGKDAERPLSFAPATQAARDYMNGGKA